MGMDGDRRLDSRVPLRGVEFHILLSLAGGERHGYGIIQDIQARGETSVPDVGTMYRALARMVDAGLIEAVERRTAPDTPDERRNYYLGTHELDPERLRSTAVRWTEVKALSQDLPGRFLLFVDQVAAEQLRRVLGDR